MLDTIPTHPWLPDLYRKHGFEERCIETFPDGAEWLQLRKWCHARNMRRLFRCAKAPAAEASPA